LIADPLLALKDLPFAWIYQKDLEALGPVVSERIRQTLESKPLAKNQIILTPDWGKDGWLEDYDMFFRIAGNIKPPYPADKPIGVRFFTPSSDGQVPPPSLDQPLAIFWPDYDPSFPKTVAITFFYNMTPDILPDVFARVKEVTPGCDGFRIWGVDPASSATNKALVDAGGEYLIRTPENREEPYGSVWYGEQGKDVMFTSMGR
jgi:hypothetical protein